MLSANNAMVELRSTKLFTVFSRIADGAAVLSVIEQKKVPVNVEQSELLGGLQRSRTLAESREVRGKDAGFGEFDAGEVWEDSIWVGSLHATRDLEALRTRGITAVLTAAKGLQVILPATFTHKIILMADHPGEDLLSKLPEALEFLREQVHEKKKRVLVHCASGVSRSVSVCMAYLMVIRGWNMKASIDHIRVNRSFANPNVGFRIQLSELEASNGDISRAKASYTRKRQGKPITDSVSSWRDQANALHRRVDDLENRIQSESGPDELHRGAALGQIKQEALNVTRAADADRVALVILKSVISKCDRLQDVLLLRRRT